MLKIYVLSLFFLVIQALPLTAQIDTLIFEELSFVEYDGTFSSYSGVFDKNDNRFLYTANNELGLIVYEIQNDELIEIDNFPNFNFNFSKVTNVDQVGNFLYLSLGDFQSIFNSNPGVAVLNVADPHNITIAGVWSSSDFNKGSAIIKVVDDFAYLGMMDSGMAIVNVANPDSMFYVSHIVPDYYFPSTPGIFSKPHTRGMAIRDEYAFICADAGGLRVIDISDKENPTEVHKYVNTYIFLNAARAYNNVFLEGNYAYVALDYCGIEVLDISDPFAIEHVALLDFWDCANSPWEDGFGHTNEISKIPNEAILLISAGDTEAIALDISIPEVPKIVGTFGTYQDSTVAWGINVTNDKLALFQLDNSGIPPTIPQPYFGSKGGVKILDWSIITATENLAVQPFSIYPNPFNSYITIETPKAISENYNVKIFNQMGQLMLEKIDQNNNSFDLDLSAFLSGM